MKRKVALLAVALLFLVAFCVTGCSVESSLIGEYEGTAGSYLKLYGDGTCIYAEADDTGSGTGTWSVKDGVFYMETSNIGYEIYGDVSNFDKGMLLQADSGLWNDEYFRKVD